MSTKKKYKHDDLVESARRWLVKEYPIVITEMTTGTETPDAIGWKIGSLTTLIECKNSRQDFLSDKRKTSRQYSGMGNYRYYLVPKDLISLDELPENWGLLEFKDKRSNPRMKLKANYRKEKDWHGEMGLLCSALRRIGGLRKEGVSVRCYQYETKNRATLSVQK